MPTINQHFINSDVHIYIVNNPASGPEPPARKNRLRIAIRAICAILRSAGILLFLIGGCGG